MLRFVATIEIHCESFNFTRTYTREFKHVMEAKRWIDDWHDGIVRKTIDAEFMGYHIVPTRKARLA